MTVQKRICEAFCAEVKVNPFSGGFGVSTPFQDSGTGDMIGFFILGPSEAKRYRLVDDALTVARFESEGATLDSQQRLASFNEILASYGGSYDEDSGELAIENVDASELERKSLNFMALLLRLQDMYLLTQEKIKNTFSEDVANRIEALKVPGLTVEADKPVSKDIDIVPDYVFRKAGQEKPLALFLATSNEKIWQAMHLQMEAYYEAHQDLSVIALLESGHTGSAKVRDKAANRLAAVPNWRGDEAAALQRILREMDVRDTPVH